MSAKTKRKYVSKDKGFSMYDQSRKTRLANAKAKRDEDKD